MDVGIGSLRDAGVSALDWTSTSYLSELYALYFNLAGFYTNPSDSYHRWLGLTVWRWFWQFLSYQTKNLVSFTERKWARTCTCGASSI